MRREVAAQEWTRAVDGRRQRNGNGKEKGGKMRGAEGRRRKGFKVDPVAPTFEAWVAYGE